MNLIIREAKPESDWLTGIWPILQEVVRAGDTFALSPGIDEASARQQWMLPAPAGVFVAVKEWNGAIVGSSFVRANQPGLGGHVANAAFMGAPGELFRHAIQLCRQHQLAGDSSVEKSRLFDCGDSPTSFSTSGARPESGCICDAPRSLRENERWGAVACDVLGHGLRHSGYSFPPPLRGCGSFFVRNRWFAPPAKFHQPSGLRGDGSWDRVMYRFL
jgi:hypothetical protein